MSKTTHLCEKTPNPIWGGLLIKDKVKYGDSVILSTHFLVGLSLRADYGYFFQNGEILEWGSLEKLTEKLSMVRIKFKPKESDLMSTVAELKAMLEIREVSIRGDLIEVLSNNRDKVIEIIKELGATDIVETYDYLRIYEEILVRHCSLIH